MIVLFSAFRISWFFMNCLSVSSPKFLKSFLLIYKTLVQCPASSAAQDVRLSLCAKPSIKSLLLPNQQWRHNVPAECAVAAKAISTRCPRLLVGTRAYLAAMACSACCVLFAIGALFRTAASSLQVNLLCHGQMEIEAIGLLAGVGNVLISVVFWRRFVLSIIISPYFLV